MKRGGCREEIFRDHQDWARFLVTLTEACAKAGWQIHAFRLRPNHCHLVVETPQANLVANAWKALLTFHIKTRRTK